MTQKLPNKQNTDLAALGARVEGLHTKLDARIAAATPDTEAIIASVTARAEELLEPVARGLEAEVARRGIQRGDTTAEAVKGMRFGEAVSHLLHN